MSMMRNRMAFLLIMGVILMGGCHRSAGTAIGSPSGNSGKSSISDAGSLLPSFGDELSPNSTEPSSGTTVADTDKNGTDDMGKEQNETMEYRILYSGDVTGVEETAAQLLTYVLSESTGKEYHAQRTDDAATAGKTDILLGNLSGEDVSKLGNEGYRITARGEAIVITGGYPRGILYGSYKFLEKYYDFHQYTKTMQVISSKKAVVSASAVKTEEYIPPFEYRETDWMTRDHNNTTGEYERYSAADFRVANGLNGAFAYADVPLEKGSMFGYYGNFTHTMTAQFINRDTYFSSHPEWFAASDEAGEHRHGAQLCLSNAEMRKKLIEEVKKLCSEANGYFAGKPFIVAVTQGDNQEYCRCSKCTKIAEQYGGQSGLMLWFVNQVADEVKKDYPNALIDTFAYQYTRTTPKNIVPRDNVIVRLCTLECCFSHTLDDKGCADNVKFYQDLQAWSKLTDRLYIWSYSTNYGHYNCPFPDFQVMQTNIQVFRDNNVKGVYIQGNHTADSADSGFAELKGYLISRLLYDPNINVEAETKQFMRAYYGSDVLYQYLTLLSKRAAIDDLHLWDAPTKVLSYLFADEIEQANACWAKVIAATEPDSIERNRVLRSQLSWRFWMACRGVEGYSGADVNKKLHEDFMSYGVKRYSEGCMIKTSGIDWNLPPSSWKN